MTCPQSSQRQFSCFYQNIQGLNSKLSNFKSLCALIDFDIITLTETWLTDNVYNAELRSNLYNVYRSDRDREACQLTKGGNIDVVCAKLMLHNVNFYVFVI